MARSYLDTASTIAALATPPGRGALAVVRVSGSEAIELCGFCFRSDKPLSLAKGYSLHRGTIFDPDTGQAVDDALASVFRNPHSYTGEDSVELSCHGSQAIVRRVLEVLEGRGIMPALPGEFTFRAFANGKLDLVEAEAVNELAGALGEKAREDALARLTGALSERYSALRNLMLDILAEIEASLDYPDDEGPGAEAWLGRLDSAKTMLEELARSYRIGKLRQEGALLVVAGKPNAGKSSLFNLFVREERAIVSPEPGTTRDWLEAWVEIGGWSVRLVDTAGLRKAEAVVEAEGVRKSEELAARADAILYLVDGAKGISAEDEAFIAAHPGAILLWNKTDLQDCLPLPQGWLGLSAKRGAHFAELEDRIVERLSCAQAPESGAPASEAEVRIASARQKRLVDACLAATEKGLAEAEAGAPLDAAALSVREAADLLGQITGEIGGEEVFDRIFGSFCLGK